ncbi:MAG: metallophosphoesterase, partial [SAR324 cluster bacterium]|nr:metallophosphoesterase [SAR324 cluster bacterium]
GEHEIHHRNLPCGWELIGWDSCHPAPWYSASGTVKQTTLEQSETLIKESDPETPFLLVNHYPISFPNSWNPDPHHELSNLEAVREWVLGHPQIRLYLHGHIHRNWILNSPRGDDTELVSVNSAASSQLLKPGQQSSFHQIQIEGNEFEIKPVLLEE